MTSDLAIIGAGPAGLTAGHVAGRAGLDAVVFEAETPGGELVNRDRIENYPGRPDVSGPELRTTLYEQFQQYDVPIVLEEVVDIRDEDPFTIATSGGEYAARAVLIACGGRASTLDVPGESAYAGRGVFYCAKCDGPLYRDEVVAVAGGDDWALTDALFLADHAAEVILFETESELPAGASLRERVASNSTIEVRTGTEITKVTGEDVIDSINVIDSAGRTDIVDVDGLYVQVGIEPNTEFLGDAIPTNDRGEIVTDADLQTETDGVFAAGDLRCGSPQTVGAAVGDGITACRSVQQYLESQTDSQP
ncbi:pyridine nucleotide-disulfide oxidoreductase [Salinadaptatus halalkaliphilus]|uniref:Pyridine nucleotide-disulfide oxidoreductase n=1 Tax=Salinadaptatus halalkaliphilus TaxID=2419781 RepID=A0A4S3TRJ9_9EURY|nr:FAD-dependent oxidoreductase [Salinadaptatus halalkaliphilus]THE65983.1 pyridine nucleotide-disulfide oxidoreductase [Salinadaptatus halalkaliphilus]